MAGVTGVGSSANDIRTNYMKLLVTQLQNQDPTAPMDNNQMSSQLAQLSSLEQLESMNTTFQQVLLGQQRQQATELLGKQVDYLPEGGLGTASGRVSGVKMYDTGARLIVGGYEIGVDQVQSVRD